MPVTFVTHGLSLVLALTAVVMVGNRHDEERGCRRQRWVRAVLPISARVTTPVATSRSSAWRMVDCLNSSRVAISLPLKAPRMAVKWRKIAIFVRLLSGLLNSRIGFRRQSRRSISYAETLVPYFLD
jgi:hypothetical protein